MVLVLIMVPISPMKAKLLDITDAKIKVFKSLN